MSDSQNAVEGATSNNEAVESPETLLPDRLTRERRQGASKSSKVLPETDQEYADAVSIYAKLSAVDSLYPGLHFGQLAGYLQQPYETQAPSDRTPSVNLDQSDTYNFVTLYDLNPSTKKHVTHYHSVEDFRTHATELSKHSQCGQLLFMRGSPSPEWLLAIGTQYKVDPLFFHRHVDFGPGYQDYFSSSSLPSTTTTMSRLCVTTIGSSLIDAAGMTEPQPLIERLRVRNENVLSSYRNKYRRNHRNFALGESIVRNCSIYDTRHFAIEQRVSVWAAKTESAWIAIVWLDNGVQLGQGHTAWLRSPLQSETLPLRSPAQYLPTIQHKPYIALKPRTRQGSATVSGKGDIDQLCQSASLLHLDYGRDLDRNGVSTDSFYALHEIYRFVAFSENQYLDMMQSKLNDQFNQRTVSQNTQRILSNMLYYQGDLERHMHCIQENIDTIADRKDAGWPTCEMEQHRKEKVEAASEMLLRDYKELFNRAQRLQDRCNKGIQMVLSNASVIESQKAIIQAKEVTKLTRLAFIFVPLSFLTSFFGMNFVQLGNGSKLSIWIWFTASIPTFIASIIFMKFDSWKGWIFERNVEKSPRRLPLAKGAPSQDFKGSTV